MRPFPVVFLPDAGAVEQETSMNRFVSVCSMALALGVGMAAVSRARERRRPVRSCARWGAAIAGHGVLASAGRGRPGRRVAVSPAGRPAVFSGAPGASVPGPGSAGDRGLRGWDPGRCPDRLHLVDAGRTISMGDPTGLDLRRWRMGGGTPPEHGQPFPIPPCG